MKYILYTNHWFFMHISSVLLLSKIKYWLIFIEKHALVEYIPVGSLATTCMLVHVTQIYQINDYEEKKPNRSAIDQKNIDTRRFLKTNFIQRFQSILLLSYQSVQVG